MKVERYVLSYKDKPDKFVLEVANNNNEFPYAVDLTNAQFYLSEWEAHCYSSMFSGQFFVEKVVFHLVDRDN